MSNIHCPNKSNRWKYKFFLNAFSLKAMDKSGPVLIKIDQIQIYKHTRVIV